MEAVMIQTGSISCQSPSVPGSPRVSLCRNNSLSSVFSGARRTIGSPRISQHFDVDGRRDKVIRRAQSESEILRSETDFATKSRSLPVSYGGKWPGSGIPTEDMRFSVGDGGVNPLTIEEVEQKKMGDYYKEMLKSNPGDPLLLRNYGKFLHEVEKDVARAEEYYCRGILASPGDGELLSLYGRLIWETQRDEERAKCYFDQAVSASPDDGMVLGSFACFMWEAEEDEEENEEINPNVQVSAAPALVQVSAAPALAS